MKNISSRRAKACSITQKTKRIVNERDEGLCVVCGRPGLPEAHVIPRHKGGLGIEQNIVTLCRECHRKFDQGTIEQHVVIRQHLESYLKGIYPNWNEDMCIYRKGRD